MSVFPTLQALLLASVASIKAILNVLVFVLIFAFAFAVVGRWVFRDSMDAISRSNFGTFWQACLTIFQLMLGDSWSDVMFAAMQSGSDLSSQLFSAVFIVKWGERAFLREREWKMKPKLPYSIVERSYSQRRGEPSCRMSCARQTQ
jgi:uncharacterized membrane protein HdeD (DUF308 family)